MTSAGYGLLQKRRKAQFANMPWQQMYDARVKWAEAKVIARRVKYKALRIRALTEPKGGEHDDAG